MRTRFLSAFLVAALGGGLAVAGPIAKAPARPTASPLAPKGRLGFVAITISPELRAHFGAPEDRGVLVDVVRPDSPAARAGVAVGDIVTDVDGASTASASDVIQALSDRTKGDAVTIAVVRDGKPLELHAKLDSDPPAPSAFGMSDDFDNWFQDGGGPDDMRHTFERIRRHMRELEQGLAPATPRGDRI